MSDEEGVSDRAGQAGPDPAVTEPAGRAPEPGVPPALQDRGWGPAALLEPEREIVRFVGRVAERSALRDWCAGLPPRSARVLLGAAGTGKTRLARQVGADWGAQAEPWRVVEPGDEPLAAAAMRAGRPGRPLLVVDEAERRDGLPELLEAALTGPGEARVLLIARSLGDWWDLLAEDCPPAAGRLLTEAPPVRLGYPLSPAATDADVAADAVPHFAAAMSLDLHGGVEVERAAMRLPVLLLHTAALLAVLRAAAGGRGPVRVVIRSRVLDELLEYELTYWRSTAAAAGLRYDAEPLIQAVTAATLAGPESLEEAEAVLARVPSLTAETAECRVEWARWLGGLYPPGTNGHLGGLRPGLLAETLAVRELAGDQVLARSFLRALPPGQAVHALTLLARACAHERAAAGMLSAVLHYDLAQLGGPAAVVAQQVPGELPGLLWDAVGNAPADPQTLSAIARGLPRPSLSVAGSELITILRARESLALAGAGGLAEWDDLAANVLRWLDGREPSPPAPGPSTGAPTGLPGWLGDPAGTGPPGAGDAGERRPAATRSGPDLGGAGQPGDGQAELAAALTSLAARCAERDRPQDALRAEEQAVLIYRRLAAADPARYRPELAASLVNLGVWVAGLTGPADAVPPTSEAAALLRDLADADPQRYRADLATCQANLAVWYSRADQAADALVAQRETASILRELALTDPERFQPELAASLVNLGICYMRAGQPADAEPAAREAVAIRRDLAAADPGGHRAGLASALASLADVLAELGREAEVAAVSAEAESLTAGPGSLPSAGSGPAAGAEHGGGESGPPAEAETGELPAVGVHRGEATATEPAARPVRAQRSRPKRAPQHGRQPTSGG